MKTCWNCRREVVDEALRCAHCGADLSKYHDPNSATVRAKPSGCAKVAMIGGGIFVGLAIIGAILGPPPDSNRVETSRTSSSTDRPAGNDVVANDGRLGDRLPGNDAGAQAGAPAAPESQWRYNSQRDEMRGTTTRFASVESENELRFDFPYGATRGHLELRQSAQFGFDVMVRVDSGQFTCHSFSGERVAVRFDDDPIRNFGCGMASDGSTEVLFIRGAQQFLSRLRRSRRVVIEAEFFREGRQQFVFNTAGLSWEGGGDR